MEYKNFESKIADQLYHAEMETDVDGLIHAIQNQGKKKRYPLFLYFTSAFILCLSFGTYFAFYNISENRELSIENFHLQVEHKTMEKKDLSENKMAITTAVNAIKNTGHDRKNEIITSGLENNLSTKNGNNSDIKIAKQSIHVEKKNSKSNEPKNINTYQEFAATEKNITHENETEKDIPITTETKEEIHQKKSVEKNTTTGASGILSLLPYNFEISELVSLDNNRIKTNRKIECPTFTKKARMMIGIMPEAGVFFPFRSLKQVNAEPNMIFDLRNTKEKTYEGLQAALYLQIQKEKSPFYLRGGLQYERISEKMFLSYEYIEKDTVQGIISMTVSQSGDTITVIYGDIVKETLVKGINNRVHYFHMFDIPVSFGYDFPYGNFNIGLELGVNLNLGMRPKGDLLTSPVNYTSIAETGAYKTHLGLSYIAGLNLSKDIGEKSKIYLSLRGKIRHNPFTTNEYQIQQRFTNLGLHLGYLWRF